MAELVVDNLKLPEPTMARAGTDTTAQPTGGADCVAPALGDGSRLHGA
jgi:hypothetical protein